MSQHNGLQVSFYSEIAYRKRFTKTSTKYQKNFLYFQLPFNKIRHISKSMWGTNDTFSVVFSITYIICDDKYYIRIQSDILQNNAIPSIYSTQLLITPTFEKKSTCIPYNIQHSSYHFRSFKHRLNVIIFLNVLDLLIDLGLSQGYHDVSYTGPRRPHSDHSCGLPIPPTDSQTATTRPRGILSYSAILDHFRGQTIPCRRE